MTSLVESSTTVRIVFDGAPYAGKTTAATSLAKNLGGAVVTPDQTGQRTAWFDWVDYTGGSHEGRPIRAEVVSVPGQDSLHHRRRHLIDWSSVIVFVADCERANVLASVERFDLLRADMRLVGKRPIVVLANKRDADDAVPLDVLRRDLRLDDDVEVIEGIATTGVGVRQAFVYAIRAALNSGRILDDQASPELLLEAMKSGEDAGRPGEHAPEPAAAADVARSTSGGPTDDPADDGVDTVDDETQTPTPLKGGAVEASSTQCDPASTAPDKPVTDLVPRTSPAGVPAAETDLAAATHRLDELVLASTTVGQGLPMSSHEWDVIVSVANGTPRTDVHDDDFVAATRALIDRGLLLVRPRSAGASPGSDSPAPLPTPPAGRPQPEPWTSVVGRSTNVEPADQPRTAPTPGDRLRSFASVATTDGVLAPDTSTPDDSARDDSARDPAVDLGFARTSAADSARTGAAPVGPEVRTATDQDVGAPTPGDESDDRLRALRELNRALRQRRG